MKMLSEQKKGRKKKIQVTHILIEVRADHDKKLLIHSYTTIK